jgi:hypothetical protein
MDKKNVAYLCNRTLVRIKGREIKIYTTTRLNFKDIMPSDISQTQKDKLLYPTYVRNVKIDRNRKSQKQKGMVIDRG